MKPGWYLLIALAVYAAVASFGWVGSRSELRSARQELAAAEETPASASDAPSASSESDPDGLWMPLPGADLPTADERLPGASRDYRDGVNQGFDFYDGEVGVPVEVGTPVVAAADGEVVRADVDYQELEPDAWEALLDDVADGADGDQLDRLRGRQVWLRLGDGRTLRYAHLAAVGEGVREGARVRRGEVIGRAGNSGTDDGVQGSDAGVRLHFEIWEEDAFLGAGLAPDEVRERARQAFVTP